MIELVLELALGDAASGPVPKLSLYRQPEFEKSVSVVALPVSVWCWSSYAALSESRLPLPAHSRNPASLQQPTIERTRVCRRLIEVLAAEAVLRLAVAGAVPLVLRQGYRLVFAGSEAAVAQTRTVVAVGGIERD